MSTTGSCAAALHAENRTIPKLIEETTAPTVTVATGPQPALGITKAKVARARRTIGRIAAGLEREVRRYQPCLGAAWAANVRSQIAPLKSYVQ